MTKRYRSEELEHIARELMDFLNTMSDMEGFAEELMNLSKAVKGYIAPLYEDKIKELKFNEVPWNELNQVIELHYKYFSIREKILKALDAFLRIVDKDYRELCNGEDLEEIAILEWVRRSQCVKIGDALMYCEFSPESKFFTYSYELKKKGLIIIGGRNDLNNVKKHLGFGGYKHVIRNINECILFLARRARDFNVTTLYTTQDLKEVPEIVKSSVHGALVVRHDLKEKLMEILKTCNIRFKVKNYGTDIVFSYIKSKQ